MSKTIVLGLFLAGLAIHPACGDQKVSPAEAIDIKSKTGGVDKREIVATVDGEPIVADDIRKLMAEKPGEVDKEQILEALIQRELLANEARRRGWETDPAVQTARQKALARVILRERIDKGIGYATLDKDKLRRYYEANKQRYVHGPVRRTRHILVKTGKKGLSDDEARKIAADAARRARDIETVEAFIEFADSFVKEHAAIKAHKGKLKHEPVPPFTADNKSIAAPYVEATFAMPRVGRASTEVKTKFGWHVIFLEEEMPPSDKSYEEVAEQLGQEVLPQEKRLKSSQLLDDMYKNGKVFVYDDAIQAMIGQSER